MQSQKMRIFYVAIFFLLLTFVLASISQAQKRVAELTLVYNYAILNPQTVDGKTGEARFSATHTIYIKGNISRTEMVSPLFYSSTIYNSNTGNAIILKEVSGQKLLIRLTPDDWTDRNKRYQGLEFTKSLETRVIAGYPCEKATAITKDSLTITVYYTRDLIPENKAYDPIFKNLDGLPLEYQLSNGHLIIEYKLSSINLNPVPESKFDIPKKGFREMTYEESKKLNMSS
jgi:GLPGLI family protein